MKLLHVLTILGHPHATRDMLPEWQEISCGASTLNSGVICYGFTGTHFKEEIFLSSCLSPS
jgi:hypothetical protein